MGSSFDVEESWWKRTRVNCLMSVSADGVGARRSLGITLAFLRFSTSERLVSEKELLEHTRP